MNTLSDEKGKVYVRGGRVARNAIPKECLHCKCEFHVWPCEKDKTKFCSRSCSSTYTYWNSDLRSTFSMKGRKFSKKTRDLLSKQRADSLHPMWKGDNVKYRGIHMWVERKLGKPYKCEHCGITSLRPRQYNWANVSKQYKRDVTDWIRLCAKCHKAFDS